MDSVIMTSSGNSTRLKSRLRNAATSFLARNSKNRQSNKNHTINHKNNRNATARVHAIRNSANLKQVNNFNRNINGNHENRTIVNNGNASTAKITKTDPSYRGSFARYVQNNNIL